MSRGKGKGGTGNRKNQTTRALVCPRVSRPGKKKEKRRRKRGNYLKEVPQRMDRGGHGVDAEGVVAEERGQEEEGGKQGHEDVEEECDAPVETKTVPLFEKMGGAEAMSGLLVNAVEIFYRKLLSDDALARYFEGVDTENLKRKQVEFLAYVFGGPDAYRGKNIAEAHRHLIEEEGLNETHFDAVAGHFRDTLVELGVEECLIDEAMGVLASARPVFERGQRAVEGEVELVKQ